MSRRPLAPFLVAALLLASSSTEAQQAGRGAPPPTARAAAPLDLAGYWVSVVIEDWKWRMVTPNKGIYEGIPLNAAARTVADSWDPAKDEAAGEQCRSYGAAALMRVPGRLRIAWVDDSTLQVDTDAGTQKRVFYFGAAPATEAPSWQGRSLARWEYGPRQGGRGGSRTGNLKVVTNNLRPGYLRKNGVPYSANAVVTEYWDVNTLPNGDQWLTITTSVEDPTYLTRRYLTSTDFKKLPNANGWAPAPCSAK